MNKKRIRSFKIKEVSTFKGFTLVELLIVFSILAMMAAIMIGILNPFALVNKAQDSRRKNDLKEIKIAFEKYYTDKGDYPSSKDIVRWNVSSNCGKLIPEMASYFKKWPCGPNNKTYEIEIIDEKSTYKVVTKLDNKTDKDIPVRWYDKDTYASYMGRKDQVNYGVSSSNILWYESEVLSPDCGSGLDCIKKVGENQPVLVSNDFCVAGGNISCYKGQPIPDCKRAHCCNGTGCLPD